MTDELASASDATIEDAVRHADAAVLRGLLYQLTSDPDILAMPGAPITMSREREADDANVLALSNCIWMPGFCIMKRAISSSPARIAA